MDAEAIAFARELLGVLREADWPARGIRLDNIPGNASNSGVTVAISIGDEPPPTEAVLLSRALERIGLAPISGTSGHCVIGVASNCSLDDGCNRQVVR
jgi:hypothetical protein